MTGRPEMTMRVQPADWRRLLWAMILSVVLHASFYGGYELGKRLGWWQNLQMPSWLNPTRLLTGSLKLEEQAKVEQPEVELPLVFVDVSQAQASVEPPKQSAFYSDKNSKAANPEPKADTETPKIDGKQTEIVKTEDVPREKAFPLQPIAPPAKEDQEEVKPKPEPAVKPGDLTLAKPNETAKKDEGQSERPRPRTIKEALARLPDNDTRPGQKMKQEGGVKRRALQSSLDVTATTFGAYDARVIYAVQRRWDELLENRLYARDRFGRVTVRFHLHADGTVTELEFVDNTVDLSLALLCQSAIRDPAPYEHWPSEMKRMIGAEYREVTFTFYYN